MIDGRRSRRRRNDRSPHLSSTQRFLRTHLPVALLLLAVVEYFWLTPLLEKLPRDYVAETTFSAKSISHHTPTAPAEEYESIVRRRDQTLSSGATHSIVQGDAHWLTPAGVVMFEVLSLYGVDRRTHAMAGDRERCLAAGMDDYVSKPLGKEDLLRALGGNGADKTNHQTETEDETLYSRARLLDQCEGDEELMARLAALFHDDASRMLEAIRLAIAERDGSELASGAHKLLSSIGAFGAQKARSLVLQLEGQGRQADFEEADERFRKLEFEFNKIYCALADYAVARV